MNMPLLLFENQVFAHSIKKEKILQGREMDEPVSKSSIENSYEAPRTRRRAAIEASIKKVLKLEPSQSTIHALSKATRKRSEAERRNLNRTRSSEEMKSEMLTREKKKVAKKARLAPDLRQKKLQVGKGPMLEMQPKAKPF